MKATIYSRQGKKVKVYVPSKIEEFEYTHECNGTKTQIIDVDRRIIKIGDKL